MALRAHEIGPEPVGSERAAEEVAEGSRPVERKLSGLLGFEGIGRVEVDERVAGDLFVVAGFPEVEIGDTLADPATPEALPRLSVDEPVLRMTFGVNTSPFAGREGKFQTSRQIRERLYRELETNLSLRVEPTEQADVFSVSGRGELHLSILIETMRREGYEFQVSRPEVITRRIDGALCEPMERLYIDTDENLIGVVSDLLGPRRARLANMAPNGPGKVRVEYTIPTRGLIGYHGELLTDTRGTAVMNRLFHGYDAYRGEIAGRRNGVLIANDRGEAVAYALWNLEDRGPMMIEPGCKVYRGMIVGEHARGTDLEVNVLKGKKLTNIRTHAKDEAVRLTPPLQMTLEQALAYIADDELVEVTPKSIRLRKKLLDPNDRRKEERRREAERV